MFIASSNQADDLMFLVLAIDSGKPDLSNAEFDAQLVSLELMSRLTK